MSPEQSTPRSADRASSGVDLAGDFGAVYTAHVGYVWRALTRLGVRDRDREDLAHDVFVVAYRRRDSFDDTRPIRPWLFGIAFRVASDHRRRARHDAEIPTDRVETCASEPGHARAAEQRELCAAALAEFDIGQRAVLVLHDLDGHTAPEIAAALAIPVNTVYSRLRLGRAKFTLAARRLAGVGPEEAP